MRQFRFELAAHPGSAAQARRLTRARLTGWSVCADTCDAAALVISELVTNAIVHTASSRVVCELRDHDDTVRIAVCDEGCAPGEPHPSPQRPDEEHGRGLLLVDAVCRSWGAQEHGLGLLVWAELPRQSDTAWGIPEPRAPHNDLGWGARPKSGQPNSSGEDHQEQAHALTDTRAGTPADAYDADPSRHAPHHLSHPTGATHRTGAANNVPPQPTARRHPWSGAQPPPPQHVGSQPRTSRRMRPEWP